MVLGAAGVIMLVATIWFLVLGFRTSIWWGLVMLIVPFVIWLTAGWTAAQIPVVFIVFALLDWERGRGAFLLMLIGWAGIAAAWAAFGYDYFTALQLSGNNLSNL